MSGDSENRHLHLTLDFLFVLIQSNMKISKQATEIFNELSEFCFNGISTSVGQFDTQKVRLVLSSMQVLGHDNI